jgi:glycosyltransferase involved in cell wall biosynthesis
MFCSFVIPTIGRASIDKAVNSILNQDFDGQKYEIIIVNDSGKVLPERDWQTPTPITTIQTYRRERNFARNSGAAVAKGRYLWFLDDDDWILPGALRAFWDLSQQKPQAAWLYGGLQIIGGKGEVLAELNSGLNGECFAQVVGGAWAPIQASIISANVFFKMGGFNPQIIGTEDLDLSRRAAYEGEFASTLENVACLFRGESWNTSTNYQRATEDIQRSRNDVLFKPGAFSQMAGSAKSAYWYGRSVRVYLSTVHWNIRHRYYFTALSRLFYSILMVLRSSWNILCGDFWIGLRADHVPGSLHFIMKENEQKNLGADPLGLN